jgi:hypothetical protein
LLRQCGGAGTACSPNGSWRLGSVRSAAEADRSGEAQRSSPVRRRLVQFVSVPDAMAGLRAAVDLLSDALLSHLAYEERELVEPIARLGLQ